MNTDWDDERAGTGPASGDHLGSADSGDFSEDSIEAVKSDPPVMSAKPHSAHDPSLSWAAPELAVAGTLGRANANGSPQARKWARIVAWTMIALLVVPIVVAVGLNLLG